MSQYNARKPGDPADPFYRRRDGQARVGGDVKLLLGSNLTLDATVNPDFGQVEVDPAVVNLSAFETFFAERRPFFVEGSGTFGFGGFSCYFCGNVSSNSLFYSRRIGRNPQGALPGGTTFARVPAATTILGAAKITGRTQGGLTLGVLNAVTSRETGLAQVGSARIRQEVEPLTNYFVARAKQDRSGGNLVVGAMATSVYRFTDDRLIRAILPTRAEALPADRMVPPPESDRRSAAAVQLRRRFDRPAGARVRWRPAPQLLGLRGLRDPPPRCFRRPSDPGRPGGRQAGNVVPGASPEHRRTQAAVDPAQSAALVE